MTSLLGRQVRQGDEVVGEIVATFPCTCYVCDGSDTCTMLLVMAEDGELLEYPAHECRIVLPDEAKP